LFRKLLRNPQTECWEWTGSRNHAGYGVIWYGGSPADGGRGYRAHRVAYELFVGPIPDGLSLDHLCRVKHCVNPEHLEPVTQRENIMRSPVAVAALQAARTHCIHGHPFAGDNLRIYTRRKGVERVCRTCERGRTRTRRAA
jgi:HNH endonuclease